MSSQEVGLPTMHISIQASIPPSMHTKLLHSIHSNNLGAESNIRRAKEVLFWPGMRSAIHDICQACTACAKYGQYARKERMKFLPLPTLPWQLVSQDRFSLQGKNYLVTVCHHSDWIETDELENTLSSTVMNATRSHFARFGVPVVCHTDNGPQFMSKEYQDYARDYGFIHITSSPYHPQRNGRAEAAVKVCKAQLRKSDDYDKKCCSTEIHRRQDIHTHQPSECFVIALVQRNATAILAAQSVDSDIVLKELQHKRTVSKNSCDQTSGPELDCEVTNRAVNSYRQIRGRICIFY